MPRRVCLESHCRYLVYGYNHFHNILRLFDVYLIFLSPQVKQSAVIGNKHGIYELPHKLPNDLRLEKIGKPGKSQNFM